MLHLRVTVAADRAGVLRDALADRPGVAHLAHLPGASVRPPGDLLLADVARESANSVVEWLQDQGVHHEGAISIELVDTVVSDAAETAEAAAPGYGADSLVWEGLEARARDESLATPSVLVLMAVATMIAAIGIMLDSPILIVGAMVVGPEYGAIASTSISAVTRRWDQAGRAVATLLSACAAGALASLLLTLLLRAAGLAPDGYSLSDRELTAFISHPDGLAAVVAVLAGVVGMLSVTQGRYGALVGVLVSATTLPAVANVGLAAAYGQEVEMAGAALQLGINVAGLSAAGVATLVVQSRLTGNGR